MLSDYEKMVSKVCRIEISGPNRLTSEMENKTEGYNEGHSNTEIFRMNMKGTARGRGR